MSLHPVSNYLVCGASSGIGLALIFQILQNHEPQQVHATYRDSSSLDQLKKLQQQYPNILKLHKLNADQESDYEALAAIEKVDVVINAIGLLHNKDFAPERKIEELDAEQHLLIYKTNTLPTLLLAKHFKKHLRASDNPVFASISAKVGSITDNRMGGWHSYRISKAALNMALKNFAIEMGRLNRNAMVVSLHPGTTETKLSEPFMAGAKKKYTIHSPTDTAKNLLSVLQSKTAKENGKFFSWDGSELPW